MEKTRKLYTVFHLNMMFSSIDENSRLNVIKQCYVPLLDLADKGYKIGIEASALTLEIIQSLYPEWIQQLGQLTQQQKVEFIGSGYSQIIGPLVPSEVNEWNLQIGKDIYKKLLGQVPKIWYINEQAYSKSMVDFYYDIGAAAIMNEWNNVSAIHSEWQRDYRFYSQRVSGFKHEINVIWNDSITFQKFQRYAHNDLDLDEFKLYLNQLGIPENASHCLYGNDAETFDFRPGRFFTEASIEQNEWTRIYHLFESLDDAYEFVFPSEILDVSHNHANNMIQLESSKIPIPVKKQPKYNVTRWGLTGRDNCTINTTCYAIYEQLKKQKDIIEKSLFSNYQRKLLYAFSSDFRTHITQKRWEDYQVFLKQLHQDLVGVDAPSKENKVIEFDQSHFNVFTDDISDNGKKSVNNRSKIKEINHRLFKVSTKKLELIFNKRKGLAIDGCIFNGTPIFGTIPHGYYEEMALSNDWFSGNLVIKQPGKSQITDLMVVKDVAVEEIEGRNPATIISCILATELGELKKSYVLYHNNAQIDVQYDIDFKLLPLSSFHLNQCTILPDAFDEASLFYATHNGGSDFERFMLNESINHYQYSSSVVSASHALGATEGLTILGDQSRMMMIITDRTKNGALPMLEHRKTTFGKIYTRLVYSLGEVDESCKGNKQISGCYNFKIVLA